MRSVSEAVSRLTVPEKSNPIQTTELNNPENPIQPNPMDPMDPMEWNPMDPMEWVGWVGCEEF